MPRRHSIRRLFKSPPNGSPSSYFDPVESSSPQSEHSQPPTFSQSSTHFAPSVPSIHWQADARSSGAGKPPSFSTMRGSLQKLVKKTGLRKSVGSKDSNGDCESPIKTSFCSDQSALIPTENQPPCRPPRPPSLSLHDILDLPPPTPPRPPRPPSIDLQEVYSYPPPQPQYILKKPDSRSYRPQSASPRHTCQPPSCSLREMHTYPPCPLSPNHYFRFPCHHEKQTQLRR